MSATVRILPSGHEFDLEPHDTVLEGGLRAGYPVAYGCSNGNCGFCAARLIDGEIEETLHSDFVFSDAEKAENSFLMCANRALGDIVVEAPEALGADDIPLQSLKARVKAVEALSDDVLNVHLRTPRTSRLRFLAGQYVRLGGAGGPTGEYTVASCPCDDRNLHIHIGRRDGAAFSEHAFNGLKANDTVPVEGPWGSFVLTEDRARPLLFLAFGTGFAPVRSLVEHAMSLDEAKDETTPMLVYWMTEGGGDPYLHNLCRSWQDAFEDIRYTPLACPGGEDDGRRRAWLDLMQRVREEVGDLAGFDVYLSAPEGLHGESREFFNDAGVAGNALHLEPLRQG